MGAIRAKPLRIRIAPECHLRHGALAHYGILCIDTCKSSPLAGTCR